MQRKKDYAHHVADIDGLCERLQVLREARGTEPVDRWQAAARAGRLEEVVHDLLTDHYDPIYLRAMARNYAHFEQAPVAHTADGSPAVLAAVAHNLAHAEAG